MLTDPQKKDVIKFLKLIKQNGIAERLDAEPMINWFHEPEGRKILFEMLQCEYIPIFSTAAYIFSEARHTQETFEAAAKILRGRHDRADICFINMIFLSGTVYPKEEFEIEYFHNCLIHGRGIVRGVSLKCLKGPHAENLELYFRYVEKKIGISRGDLISELDTVSKVLSEKLNMNGAVRGTLLEPRRAST